MLEFTRGTKYPLLPLRDIVVFPHMAVPLFVGRQKSINALEAVMDDDKPVLLVAQKNSFDDDPSPKDLYTVGTLANVLQMLKLPDGTVKVLVEGISRVSIKKFSSKDEYFEVSGKVIDENISKSSEDIDAMVRSVLSEFEAYVKLNKKIPADVLTSVHRIEVPSKLADTLSSYLNLKISEKQELLEISDAYKRLERIYTLMSSEMDTINIERQIHSRVKRQMEKTQKEYYLNEQMKAIQSELGDEDGKNEFDILEAKIKKTKLSKEAREKAESELKKLRATSPMSAESSVIRNYLDWIVGVPWKKPTKVKKDLAFAQKVLNQDHYGLEKVKERILEALAVQQRVGKLRGPIICLVGPPGVGKTSLGQSIARATGRNFIRVALGGVRDESEIRGHRRTYIGSMPGKIVQGMKKAKSSNPLFLLDEVDKLGSDWRGDPSSSLLEVLDPEQNEAFNDHYLEVDYDLSDVMFVTTANSLNMPAPLLDRMEIIRLSGYTEDEKLEIAKRHLIKKQLAENGLKKGEWSISDKAMIDLIRYYTREAGVRSLERELSKLARKAVKELITDDIKKISVTPKNLEKYQGPPTFAAFRVSFGKRNEIYKVLCKIILCLLYIFVCNFYRLNSC